MFDNRDAAENCAFNISNKWDTANVEEWELNSACDRKEPMWEGLMYRDGRIDYPGQSAATDEYIRLYPNPPYPGDGGYISFAIHADTVEGAAKVINEKRAALIKSGFWDNPFPALEQNQYYWELK